MIESVSFEKTTFEKLPFKFEAGTPDYVATHGLAKAIDYVSALGMDNIAKHEQELTRYCMEQMRTIDGIRLLVSRRARMLLSASWLVIFITWIWEPCSTVWALLSVPVIIVLSL